MNLRRTPIALLVLTCLFASAPPRAEAKPKKPDQVVVQLRREALQIGRTAQITARNAGLDLAKSIKALAKQVTKGTVGAETAFDRWCDEYHDYWDACFGAADGATSQFVARYERIAADSPENGDLAREIHPFAGNAADQISATVDFILDDARSGANRAFVPLAAAFDCADFDVTWTGLRPLGMASPLTAHLRGLGQLPAGFAAPPQIVGVGATCRGKLRFSAFVDHADPEFDLITTDIDGKALGPYTVLANGDVEYDDVPEGVYRFESRTGGLVLQEGVAVAYGWSDSPVEPVCPVASTLNFRFDGQPVATSPLTGKASVQVEDATGNVEIIYFKFEGDNRVALSFSKETGGNFTVLSPSTPAVVTLEQGSVLGFYRPLGSAQGMSTGTGVFKVYDFAKLVTEPAGCIRFEWAGGAFNNVPASFTADILVSDFTVTRR